MRPATTIELVDVTTSYAVMWRRRPRRHTRTPPEGGGATKACHPDADDQGSRATSHRPPTPRFSGSCATRCRRRSLPRSAAPRRIPCSAQRVTQFQRYLPRVVALVAPAGDLHEL